jgi:hypothetical protein
MPRQEAENDITWRKGLGKDRLVEKPDGYMLIIRCKGETGMETSPIGGVLRLSMGFKYGLGARTQPTQSLILHIHALQQVCVT